MQSLRTKQEDAVMNSWSSVMRRERRSRTARATAWLMFLATAAPWAAYAGNGGLMSLKRVAAPEPSNLGTVVKDRNACVQLGKAFFLGMQAASDGLGSCGTRHLAGAGDPPREQQLPP